MAAVFSADAYSSVYSFPSKYDRQIRSAASLYLPGVDWRLWKAQLYQESRLDPNAVSPVGASGLAQFMPATWEQVSREMGTGRVSPFLAEPAILAGAYYMGRLRSTWSSERSELDRHKLAAASYNAGIGSMLQAQRLCQMQVTYDAIIRCLPQVTGRHSAETIQYIERIWYWYRFIL